MYESGIVIISAPFSVPLPPPPLPLWIRSSGQGYQHRPRMSVYESVQCELRVVFVIHAASTATATAAEAPAALPTAQLGFGSVFASFFCSTLFSFQRERERERAPTTE